MNSDLELMEKARQTARQVWLEWMTDESVDAEVREFYADDAANRAEQEILDPEAAARRKAADEEYIRSHPYYWPQGQQ